MHPVTGWVYVVFKICLTLFAVFLVIKAARKPPTNTWFWFALLSTGVAIVGWSTFTAAVAGSQPAIEALGFLARSTDLWIVALATSPIVATAFGLAATIDRTT